MPTGRRVPVGADDRLRPPEVDRVAAPHPPARRRPPRRARSPRTAHCARTAHSSTGRPSTSASSFDSIAAEADPAPAASTSPPVMIGSSGDLVDPPAGPSTAARRRGRAGPRPPRRGSTAPSPRRSIAPEIEPDRRRHPLQLVLVEPGGEQPLAARLLCPARPHRADEPCRRAQRDHQRRVVELRVVGQDDDRGRRVDPAQRRERLVGPRCDHLARRRGTAPGSRTAPAGRRRTGASRPPAPACRGRPRSSTAPNMISRGAGPITSMNVGPWRSDVSAHSSSCADWRASSSSSGAPSVPDCVAVLLDQHLRARARRPRAASPRPRDRRRRRSPRTGPARTPGSRRRSRRRTAGRRPTPPSRRSRSARAAAARRAAPLGDLDHRALDAAAGDRAGDLAVLVDRHLRAGRPRRRAS